MRCLMGKQHREAWMWALVVVRAEAAKERGTVVPVLQLEA
jgi:hypothetical protein